MTNSQSSKKKGSGLSSIYSCIHINLFCIITILYFIHNNMYVIQNRKPKEQTIPLLMSGSFSIIPNRHIYGVYIYIYIHAIRNLYILGMVYHGLSWFTVTMVYHIIPLSPARSQFPHPPNSLPALPMPVTDSLAPRKPQ